jgi:hypothetical protein
MQLDVLEVGVEALRFDLVEADDNVHAVSRLP